MNKYLIGGTSIFILVLITWYFYSSRTHTLSFKNNATTEIKLYFYNPALDQDIDGVMCSENGLVAVSRVITSTITPLADTVKLLLRGEISDEERISGIESEFPLTAVTLKNASISNGVATLTFDDPQNKTSGGSCRVTILRAQIEATAKQFPTVKSIRLMPEELFQP